MDEDEWLVDITDIIYDFNWTDTITINTAGPVEFEDTMPCPTELKRMCEEYPGLDKAYENFKTFYKLVEQDWRGKQKDAD